MLFLDSNIVIDVADGDARWSYWSREMLMAIGEPLICNAVVLAETAPRFTSMEQQKTFFDDMALEVVAIGRDAAFAAGLAQLEYRRRGGVREAIVADFLIGAHAQTLGATLITRDRARFATYFPDLTLITPETHP